MPGEMWLTFLVSLLGITLLYLTLVRLELSAKHTRGRLKRLRKLLETEPSAGPPATPLTTVPARPSYD
jgi:hypothetical protein